MISDEQLDTYRVEGKLVRVVRDANRENDVRGYVVAWDDQCVLVRKLTKRVVKLDRRYEYLPSKSERKIPPAIADAIGADELGDEEGEG